MGLAIECECGALVCADTEDGLVTAAQAHIERMHSAAVGAVSRSDLLAMARRTDAGGAASPLSHIDAHHRR